MDGFLTQDANHFQGVKVILYLNHHARFVGVFQQKLQNLYPFLYLIEIKTYLFKIYSIIPTMFFFKNIK